MIKRIVGIEQRSYLYKKNQQLVVEQDQCIQGTIPIEDLGVLVLSDPAIVLTQSLIVACLEEGAVIIFCDRRHMPASVLLPLDGHSLHAKVLETQIGVTKPVKKRLWKQIITQKIRHQALVLDRFQAQPQRLLAMSRRVKSGDPENLEAQAAKYYWKNLFPADFQRNPDGGGINACLNYGYAILRAAIARAICATGLHPALGIHHCNQYNAMQLADDLVEPLRPMVDTVVYELLASKGSKELHLDSDTKQCLLSIAASDCIIGDAQLPLMVALSRYTASLKKAFEGNAKTLEIPSI